MCQAQPSHDLNMKYHWSFKNTINGKTQNIAIKGNTIMLMNEYGSFPQERANWQNVITKESPVGWAFQKVKRETFTRHLCTLGQTVNKYHGRI